MSNMLDKGGVVVYTLYYSVVESGLKWSKACFTANTNIPSIRRAA